MERGSLSDGNRYLELGGIVKRLTTRADKARLLSCIFALFFGFSSTSCCLIIPIPFLSSTSGSSLEGLYVGTESRQDFNPATGYYDYKVRQIYYLFFPDGRVYYGLPKGVLDDFNFERALNEDPKNCGTYQISGDQIQFNWQNTDSKGAEKSVSYRPGNNNIQIGQTTFYSVKKFDGLQLNGFYSAGSFVNTSNRSLGTQGGVGSEQAIIFGSDGTFIDRGFIGYTGSTDDVGSGSSESNTNSGTYSITGNTLELSYQDRSSRRYSFFVYPENVGETQPGLIVIDGKAFLLRQKP
jgi:hypothetical protein